MAETIPQLKEVARLEVEELMRVGSSAITMANWLTLTKRINEILARDEGVEAVVVTHGSNTVEETAYFLGLTVKSDKPVVLTAAQRQFSTLSSDSPKNFLQAVRVAASDAARGKGALVLAEAAVERGKAEGLVVAAFPTGSPSPAMEQALSRLAGKGIPVVITNRGGMGRVRDTRAGAADAKRFYLWGDNLTPQKARILLMLALTRTREAAELQRIFDEY